MELYWKATGGIMVALVLTVALGKQQKDFSVVLTMAVCAMTAMAAMIAVEPVLSFLKQLEILGDWQNGVLGILLKITGIALLTEISALLCTDGGSSGMGRSLQLWGCVVIFRLSVPLMESMLKLIQEFVGEL